VLIRSMTAESLSPDPVPLTRVVRSTLRAWELSNGSAVRSESAVQASLIFATPAHSGRLESDAAHVDQVHQQATSRMVYRRRPANVASEARAGSNAHQAL